MSSDRLPRTLHGATIVLLAVLLIPISCGQAPLMAPEEGAPRTEIDIVDLSVPGDVMLQGEFQETEEIGPEGGSLEIEGFIRIDVPPGAVHDEADFELKIVNPDKYEWELSPHGEDFHRPVTLTVFLANAVLGDDDDDDDGDDEEDDDDGDESGWQIEGGTSPEDLEVYWKNKGSWWPQGSAYDAEQHAMIVELDHFSRYALATE